MLRRIGWIVMTITSLFVAAYALALLFAPGVRPPLLRNRLASGALPIYLHLGAAAIAIAVGPFQLSTRLRTRFRRLHRLSGRFYVGGVFVGGLASLALAMESQGGSVAHAGFLALGVLWIATTAEAFRRILAKDIRGHRRWMIRSWALTFAAVTLRVYLPASIIAGLPYQASYAVIAWLCWVPNVIAAEWYLAGRWSLARMARSRHSVGVAPSRTIAETTVSPAGQ